MIGPRPGQGEHEIDLEAMKAGAADYLVKGRLDSGLLERSIRYALERKRGVDRAASEQARLAAFGEEIGLALTRQDALETILHRCAAAMVQYLRAGIARIWILDEPTSTLKLHASVGSRSDTAFLSSRAPQPAPELELGSQPAPTLISPVAGDKRFSEQEWARRKGVQGFAAYPLLLEERTVGLMSMFSSAPLSGAVLQEMASVAHGIALCIERKRSALALDASEVKYRSVVENIKEVIFQTDREGRWTFLNPAWTQITGFPAEQSLGSCFTDYIHPEDRERHREIFQDVLEQRKSYCQDETRYLAADGTFRWMEVYAQPVVTLAFIASRLI